ncbi:MAG: phosphotransferase, partial [Planctomycetota bacterium]
FAGALEYTDGRSETATLGLLQAYVESEGDGWRYTLDELADFYEQLSARRQEIGTAPQPPPIGTMAADELPEDAVELFGRSLPSIELLGQRTAEMHAALAARSDDPAFAAEPFTLMYQRSLYQSLRNSARRSLALLRARRHTLAEPLQRPAEELIGREQDLVERLMLVSNRPLSGMRTRIHGDYHLGQVLWTGRDFVIIDFEGEPARALSERRLKWTPLRDIAGMFRSFHYAAHAALREQVQRGLLTGDRLEMNFFEPWAAYWHAVVTGLLLSAYRSRLNELDNRLLPADETGVQTLLDAWVLEKAMYEVAYELNNRPDWVGIPLRGALEVLD